MMAQNRVIQQHSWIPCTPLLLAYCCTFLFFDILFSDKLAICSSWFPGRAENKLSGRLQIRGLIKTTFIKAENPERREGCYKCHEQTGFTLASHFPLILLKTGKVGCKAAAEVPSKSHKTRPESKY